MSLTVALSLTYDQLIAIAQSPDYWTILKTAFGSSYDSILATTLQQQWQTGDFSTLPPIEILSSSVLGIAQGAYSQSTNRIYLFDQFLATASETEIVAVLLEEIGHYLDAQLNTIDTPGDEGELFSLLVRGIIPSANELNRLQRENDQAIITLDGQSVSIEMSSATIHPNPFYAVQASGTTSVLYLLDITTGNKTLIPGGTLAFQTFAIARDFNTGRVYYVGTQSNGSAQVAYWDPATQTNTTLPNPTGQSVQFLKLAQAQDGTIYGLGSTANLYSINQNTGSATNLGSITGGSPAFTGGSGDAAFDPNNPNILFVSVVAGSQLRVYKVNITTRAATYVGHSGLASVTSSGSLGFGEDGELYAVITSASGITFSKLNQTDGSATTIQTGSDNYGDFGSLPTPTPNVDFTITQTDNLTDVASGENITYTISLKNNAIGDRIMGLIVKDTIPNDVTVSTWDASITNTSGESNIINGASGTNNDIFTSVNIGPQDTLSFTIRGTVTAASGTVITNKVEVPGIKDTSSDDTLIDITNVINKPMVNLSVSSNTGTEAGTTAITVTATASSAVSGNQTVNLAVTGTGITPGDYTLSNSTITILNGQT
ncbi:MAG: hypothetical protein ACK456_15715, partial [Pseudanabaenaceae cyanobacterium]